MPVSHLQLAKPLLNQIVAFVQRDQLATIAAVNSALLPITEFHKGPRTFTAMPWMILGYRDTTFDETSEQSQHQLAVIDIVLDVGQYDGELAQDMAMDYLIVLDAILRNAGPPPSYIDWMTPLPVTLESVQSNNGVPLATTLHAGGIGYHTGDTVQGQNSGTTPFTATVLTVSGPGGVLTYSVTSVGNAAYAVGAVEPMVNVAPQSGAGTGLTLNITAITPLTTPLPVGSIKEIFIQREGLAVVNRQDIDGPVLAVNLELKVEFEEYMLSSA